MKRTRLVLLGSFVLIASLAAREIYADEWFSCIPTEIMEFDNRVHVRCSNVKILGNTDPDAPESERTTVRYIAIDKTDVEKAERFISLATTAIACGYTFRVEIPESGQDNADGCRASDCRTPNVFGVMK